MGWKNFSYWLKGGIVGLIVSAIAGIILALTFGYTIYLVFFPITIIYNLLGLELLILEDNITVDFFVIFSLYGVVFYILIGALIGWTYGKIKSR